MSQVQATAATRGSVYRAQPADVLFPFGWAEWVSRTAPHVWHQPGAFKSNAAFRVWRMYSEGANLPAPVLREWREDRAAIIENCPDDPSLGYVVWAMKHGAVLPIGVSGMQSIVRAAIKDGTPEESVRCAVHRVHRADADKQEVFAVVYEPYVLDTWGEFMLPEDVRAMAERFDALPSQDRRIDLMHDNVPVNAEPIKSFIAGPDDPDYPEGAWVLGVKVHDARVWSAIKAGRINGFSFEAMVRKVPAVVDVEILRDNVGMTMPAEDGHTHLFFAELDDEGRVRSGRTTTDAGHSHMILSGTATEVSQGHGHRFFLEGVQ